MDVSFYDGCSKMHVKDTQDILKALRTYLEAVSEFGLAISTFNFTEVCAEISSFGVIEGREDYFAGFEEDPSTLGKPLLSEFERDLVHIQVNAPLSEFESAPRLKATWRTSASMRRFADLIDAGWQQAFEYSGPGEHQALDQARP